jgi:hypothetical protein
MKHKITVLLMIFIAACAFAAFSVLHFHGGETRADSVFSLEKITAISSDGVEYEIQEKVWASRIRLYYRCDYPYIKVEMASSTGWSNEADFIIPDGTYVAEVPHEGVITVVASVYNNHQTFQSSITSVVYMDNTAPLEPDLDRVALDTYHISEFPLRYRFYTDNFSGLNYDISKLAFDAEEEANSIPLAPLSSFILPPQRGLDNYLIIRGKGTLYFYLEDNAGNISEFTYDYYKYGVPETGVPTISLSTVDFAKSVTVTVNWGTGYDDNPYAEKKYAIETPGGAIPYNYTGPIVIDTEGTVVLRIYYYEDGERRYVTRVINNVDRTPPSLLLMQDSAKIECNVMAEDPVIFYIKAYDALSGINRVYFKTGGNLAKEQSGYYSAPILDMYSFTVVAEDYAGNKTEYTYHNNYFDYNTVKAAHAAFLSAVREEYTPAGWAAIEDACDALSSRLLDDMASSSDIAALKRDVDAAVAGTITIVNRISAVPSGLDEGAAYTLDPAATDALKGEIITIKLDKASSDSLAKTAAARSGYKKKKVYPFSITLSGESTPVHLTGSMAFNMSLPAGAINAKIYVVKDGDLQEITASVTDGRIYAATSTLGDMYLVAEQEKSVGLDIFGKTYSWTTLGITAASIVVVCAVGFVLSYMIFRRRGH